MADEPRTALQQRRPLPQQRSMQHASRARDTMPVLQLAAAPTRYLHLPIQDAKHARRDLQASLSHLSGLHGD